MTPENESAVFTVSEAARLLRISRNSAFKAARQGELPTLRFGRRLVVPKAKLLKMLGEAGSVARSDDP